MRFPEHRQPITTYLLQTAVNAQRFGCKSLVVRVFDFLWIFRYRILFYRPIKYRSVKCIWSYVSLKCGSKAYLRSSNHTMYRVEYCHCSFNVSINFLIR